MNWVLSPSKRLNGYHYINNYPFYIHNGYRHRYSNVETCNYQLVDKNTHSVQGRYNNNLCSVGYNSCANERDNMNNQFQENKYFCAENFKEDNILSSNDQVSRDDQNVDISVDDQTIDVPESDQSIDVAENDQSIDVSGSDQSDDQSCFDRDEETGECFDN